ncbi:MAG: hypothetical protein R3D97_12290 [Paracoccaceae bacterium]
MSSQRRWMKWVLADSADLGIPLPWQRGFRPKAIRSRRIRIVAE